MSFSTAFKCPQSQAQALIDHLASEQVTWSVFKAPPGVFPLTLRHDGLR